MHIYSLGSDLYSPGLHAVHVSPGRPAYPSAHRHADRLPEPAAACACAGHSSHCVAFAAPVRSKYVSLGHGTHAAASGAGPYEPAGHGRHSSAVSAASGTSAGAYSWNAPGGHTHPRSVPAPSADVDVDGQATGVTDPSGQYAPAGHAAHAWSPMPPLKLPAAQSRQLPSPTPSAGAKKRPATHTHCPGAELASPSVVSCAAHAAHVVFPAAVLYVPSAHASHRRGPSKNPASHTQSVASLAFAWYCVVEFAGHRRHANGSAPPSSQNPAAHPTHASSSYSAYARGSPATPSRHRPNRQADRHAPRMLCALEIVRATPLEAHGVYTTCMGRRTMQDAGKVQGDMTTAVENLVKATDSEATLAKEMEEATANIGKFSQVLQFQALNAYAEFGPAGVHSLLKGEKPPVQLPPRRTP